MRPMPLLNVMSVGVPSNITHLLQPLDLTTNSAAKKIEKGEFSNYFTEASLRRFLKNPDINVTTIKVDLRLKTLNPRQALTTQRVYKFLKSERGKEIILAGWKAAGIMGAVKKGHNGDTPTLNPFE